MARNRKRSATRSTKPKVKSRRPPAAPRAGDEDDMGLSADVSSNVASSNDEPPSLLGSPLDEAGDVREDLGVSGPETPTVPFVLVETIEQAVVALERHFSRTHGLASDKEAVDEFIRFWRAHRPPPAPATPA